MWTVLKKVLFLGIHSTTLQRDSDSQLVRARNSALIGYFFYLMHQRFSLTLFSKIVCGNSIYHNFSSSRSLGSLYSKPLYIQNTSELDFCSNLKVIPYFRATLQDTKFANFYGRLSFKTEIKIQSFRLQFSNSDIAIMYRRS